MARGRVQMKRIENKKYRQVTFAKRRSGLIKKAHEISVLCDAQVALIIFSSKGNLFEFSSDSRMEKILKMYNNFSDGESESIPKEDKLEGHWAFEAAKFKAKIELLEKNHRNYLGQDLDAMSVTEIQSLEHKIEVAVKRIRARKEELMLDSISKLLEKEREMQEQNYMLLNKIKEKYSKAEEYSSSLTYTQLLASPSIEFSSQRGNVELTLEPTE